MSKKCSVDHERYKSGAELCIKYGYFIDHRIQCSECDEYLEPCKHINTSTQYGFMTGLPGIGAYTHCDDCGELIEYLLDYSSCSEFEIKQYEESEFFNG